MAAPGREARLRAEASGFGMHVEKGAGYLRSAHNIDPNRFLIQAGVGNVGWHLSDGTEVDTTLINLGGTPNAQGYFHEMVTAPYQFMLGRDAAITFNAAQIARYYGKNGIEYLEFDPEALQWTNDNDQIEQIGVPQSVPGTVSGDTVTWPAAYGPAGGPGDSRYTFELELQSARAQKRLNIATALAAPPSFITTGPNPALELRYITSRSAGLEIWVDEGSGYTLWNEQNNSTRLTGNPVQLRYAATGEIAFIIPPPWAEDSSAPDATTPKKVTGWIHMRKRPGEIQMGLRIPWLWLQTAAYPVVVDPTIDQVVGADASDGGYRGAQGFQSTTAWQGYRTSPGAFAGDHETWAYFSITDIAGATINTAYIQTYGKSGTNSVTMKIRAEDAGSGTPPTDTASYTGKTHTTAGVDWDYTQSTTAWNQSPSIVSVIQELCDTYGTVDAIGIYVLNDGTTGQNYNEGGDYNWSTSNNTNLYIDYTEASSGYTITAGQGSFTLSGQSSGLFSSRLLTTTQGALNLSGQAANLLRGFKLVGGQGALALSGQDAVLSVSRLLVAAQGSLLLSGQSAGLMVNRLLGAEQGAFTLDGQDAGLAVSRLLIAAYGAYTLTGQDAVLTYNSSGATYTLTAAGGTFVMSGQDVNLLIGRLLAAGHGLYSLGGQNADLLRNYLLTAAQGSQSLSGQDINILAGRLITAAAGTFALTGRSATLDYSGEIVGGDVVAGDAKTYTVAAADGGTYLITANDEKIYVVELMETNY